MTEQVAQEHLARQLLAESLELGRGTRGSYARLYRCQLAERRREIAQVRARIEERKRQLQAAKQSAA